MFKKMVECDVEKSERDETRKLLRQLVYSKDADVYEDTKQELYSHTNKQFTKYFQANWDKCQEMWVTIKRDYHVHLGNTTNNRLESYNQKLKHLTQRSSNLTEMFQNLLKFSDISASEFNHCVFMEEFTTTVNLPDTDTPGVHNIRSVCTQYASNLMSQQLQLAQTVKYQISAEDVDQYVLTVNESNIHRVNVIDNICSCSFKRTLMMPCRHVFALRMYLKMVVFTEDMVATRWLKSYQASIVTDDSSYHNSHMISEHNQVQVCSIQANTTLSTALSHNQKYKKMRSLTDKLSLITSECGMPQFLEKFVQLQKLVGYWENDIPAYISTQDVRLFIHLICTLYFIFL